MAKMNLTDIDDKTLTRLHAISKKNETSDEVINRLVDTLLGFGCPHTDQGVYLEAVYDDRGYIDMNKSVSALAELRYGRPTTSMVRVCKSCLRGMKIKQ